MSLVLTELEGRVAFVTLNRPEARNALSVELCNEIVTAFEGIDTKEFRVVVLRGAGKTFCSGADFAAVTGEGGLDFVPAFERMLEFVARFILPTVAAVQGAALGGGLQLASVCDFRLAASDAKIGIPSSRLGIVVNFENVRRLVHLVGAPVAREVLMTGRTYSGDAAESAGLVNEVIDPGHLFERVGEFAAEIAALAPLSVQGAKKEIQLVIDHIGPNRTDNPEEIAEMDALVAEAYGSTDLSEGISAMSEKRKARFEGR